MRKREELWVVERGIREMCVPVRCEEVPRVGIVAGGRRIAGPSGSQAGLESMLWLLEEEGD